MRIKLLIRRRKVRKPGPLKRGRALVNTARERIRGLRRNIA